MALLYGGLRELPLSFPPASSLAGLSPQPTKFVKPMRTVIEEQSQQREVQSLLIEDEDEQVCSALIGCRNGNDEIYARSC